MRTRQMITKTILFIVLVTRISLLSKEERTPKLLIFLQIVLMRIVLNKGRAFYRKSLKKDLLFNEMAICITIYYSIIVAQPMGYDWTKTYPN